MKVHGYYSDDNQTRVFIRHMGSNTAFFPAFPYLWRYLHLNAWQISAFNLLLLFISVIWLCHVFKIDNRAVFLFLSLPSQFFFYIPYSESLFLIFTAFILVGYYFKNITITAGGYLLGGVTRSAGNIFIPAIVLTGWVSERKSWKAVLIFSFFSMLAIAMVMLMQYHQTGDALGFVHAQKFWGHRLQWPKLPFTTWGKFIFLDAGSLMFGLTAMGFSIYIMYKRLIKREYFTNPAVFFSLVCLTGLTLLALAFKGGSLFSLNRYLLPSAFTLIGGAYLFKKAGNLSNRDLLYCGLIIFIMLISFHFFTHIRVILRYTALTLYLMLYLLSARLNRRYSAVFFVILYLANCFLQVYFLDEFFHGQWIA
jgi:hypothetical protein